MGNDLAVTIRPYRDTDWGAICRIHDRARPQEVAGVMPPGTSAPLAQAAVDEDLFDSRIVVACLGDAEGPVVGFAAYEDALLTWLYVDPELQGKGVGKALMAHVLPLLGPEGWVMVLDSNQRAVAFYVALGFHTAAVFPGDCEGYACQVNRMCLPGSSHADRPPQPFLSSLLLAGHTEADPGAAVRGADGVWRWVRASSGSENRGR